MLAAYHHAAVALRRAPSVVVCGHLRPDGDAIGSALALTLALRSIGVPAIPTLAEKKARVPKTYEFLPGAGLYAPLGDLEVPAVFVALDTPNLGRLGEAAELAEAADTLVVMDHHPDAQEYGDVNVCDSKASSTSLMVWRLVTGALEVKPTPEVAMCCYVGLITDTGRFQYDNTTADGMREAADMIDAGVEPADVARLVYQDRSVGSLALEARAMERITVCNHGHTAWSWIEESDFTETGAIVEEAEYLPDAVRLLGGIDAVALLRVWGDEVRVGLRSKTGYDVGSVARHFGGGGHKAASGFTWTGTKEDLLAEMLPLLPGGDRVSKRTSGGERA
jgi:bifunctional oligoribonuclease and PAP phosphatase NrnA